MGAKKAHWGAQEPEVSVPEGFIAKENFHRMSTVPRVNPECDNRP